MLGLDADLEADLGIDSIKRVEILGALQKALPADLGAGESVQKWGQETAHPDGAAFDGRAYAFGVVEAAG